MIMTIEKLLNAAEPASRYVPTATAELITGLANAARELAAENAMLKNFISRNCYVAHIEEETFYAEELTRYVSADGYEPETPATDRVLTEQRALGVESVGDYLKKYGQGLHEEARLVLQDAGELCKGFAAALREGATDEQ